MLGRRVRMDIEAEGPDYVIPSTSAQQQPPQVNINLMNLCLEILDNEHDLDRANGEINPLYIYCNKHINPALQTIFRVNTYQTDTNPMNPRQILIKMKNIVNARNAGSFTPAGANTPITYNYKESIESFGKDFDNLRMWIKSNNKRIGQCLAETYRGVRANPTNNNPKLVNVYRSALTTQFDNQCSWESVLLQNAKIIGDVGTLNSKRIYDNYFPKAASVFVYGSELKSAAAAAAAAIIDLIPANRTSVLPFTEAEYPQMRGELSAFITFISGQLATEKLYLLHIFKVFNTSTGKTGGGSPQYSFSLQFGQVELNEVSIELYGYNKRGSKLCNILCASGQNPVSTIDDKMHFSVNIPFHMKNCHISYGKLCGDGVTIFAAKKARFESSYNADYNAVISIDEFCCLRAVYAGIIVAYQQKPSAMAATGLGSLSTNRNHGIYQVGNIKLSATEAASAEIKQAADVARAAAALAKRTAILNLNNIISVITETWSGQFKPVPRDMFLKLFQFNALNLNDKTTTQINEMVDFCVQYSNILINLNLEDIAFSQGERTTRTDGIIMDQLGGLGTLELLLEQFRVTREISREHIVYIMITQLFINKSFTDHINSFIVKLFDVEYIAPPDLLPAAGIQSNSVLTTKYRNGSFNFDEFFPKVGGYYAKTSYKPIYDNMLTIYNIFNQYNCDDDLSDGNITETQCKFKHMLRQRLVIFKYIYRAYTTCCLAMPLQPTPTSSVPTKTPIKARLNTSSGVASVLGGEYKDWGGISEYVNGGKMTPGKFTTAYNAMITDRAKSIQTASQSPVTSKLLAQQDEDKLGEVIVDDDYKQDSNDTSCETLQCSSVCTDIEKQAMEALVKASRFRLNPPSSMLKRPLYGRKKSQIGTDGVFRSSQRPTASVYPRLSKKTAQTAKAPRKEVQPNKRWGLWGGQKTRKRKPSKKPRRTIRRQQRNKKGTQKRRK